MFDPKFYIDTYGYKGDFINRPEINQTRIISIDARNRDVNADTVSAFSVRIPRLKQVRSIELREGFVTLPDGYLDPYALVFLQVDGSYLGNLTNGGPPTNARATSTIPNQDAVNEAFAQLTASAAGFVVGSPNESRIVLRFPGTPLPKVEAIRVTVTDWTGTPLPLVDESTSADDHDRCWLQLEVACALGN